MPNKANVDAIFRGQFHGNVAQRLQANGMNPRALRPWVGDDGQSYVTANVGGESQSQPTTNAATLRKDEWKQYDQAIIKIARERLVGVGDLVSRGLTYNIGNGLAKTVLEYEDMSDPGTAHVSMDGLTRGENDRPEFVINYLPLPIVHSDFFMNARVLAASRTTGDPLDVTMAEAATRRVLEQLEDMLFTNTTYTYGGGTIRSYINHPDRNTATLSSNWDASAKTGANILDDVQGMIQASIDANHFGPWVLYIPTSYQTVMDDDYTTGYPKSIRTRLLELDGLQGIRVADRLTADNVVLVQMTSDVVRMVIGMAVTPVEWQTEGGMLHHFKVMTIQVPQIRSDQDGNSGIVHLS